MSRRADAPDTDRPDAAELAQYAAELRARRAAVRRTARAEPLPTDDPWAAGSPYRDR